MSLSFAPHLKILSRSIEFTQKKKKLLGHWVEKSLDHGEKSFLTMIVFLYVCLDSDIHDNLRTKSRIKFLIMLKCVYFRRTD